jgi:hypothetical protein
VGDIIKIGIVSLTKGEFVDDAMLGTQTIITFGKRD